MVQIFQADAKFFGGDDIVAVVALEGLANGVDFRGAVRHPAVCGRQMLRSAMTVEQW